MRVFFLFVGWLSVSMYGYAQDTTSLTLMFAGDVMGHDSQIAAAWDKATNQYDYDPCFQFVKPYIESVDMAIANLEVTLAGPPYKGYPQFSSPDALAQSLKTAGFDVLVTANNHSVDRGKKGIERTIYVLDSLSIPHTGTFIDDTDRLNNYPMLLQKNGISIALLNYTYGTNGIPVPKPTVVNLIDTAVIRKDLLQAQALQPDVILTFIHWGTEYESLPRKNQKDLAEFCFRHGTDLLIGAHPHVLQPMEWRKEKNQLVVYSLGNFVSGQRKRYTDGGATAYVGLKKIRYAPDSIVTTIDTTGYVLNWVYRTVDANKDYYVLPVPAFEADTTGFIKDETSKGAFKTFAQDSRQLYGEHNVHVPELKYIPADTLVRYSVDMTLVADTTTTDIQTLLTQHNIDTFYGVRAERVEETQTIHVSIGSFTSEAKAQRVCDQLTAMGAAAKVVRYINGVPLMSEEVQAEDEDVSDE